MWTGRLSPSLGHRARDSHGHCCEPDQGQPSTPSAASGVMPFPRRRRGGALEVKVIQLIPFTADRLNPRG